MAEFMNEQSYARGDKYEVELKDYIEAILNEQERARTVASVEREKSAGALRAAAAAQIREGDDRLRDHIDNQIQQMRGALTSGELLEKQRIALVNEAVGNLDSKVAGLFEEKQKALDAALTAQKEAVVKAEVATDRIAARAQTDQEGLRADMQERLAAVRRELEQATAAQKEAVLKAEAANQKVFEGQNEWRSQSADRERSQQDAMAKLTSTYMPREVAESQISGLRHVMETQFAEQRKLITALQDRQNLAQGQNTGSEMTTGRMLAVAAVIISLITAIASIAYIASLP